jgi:hypothetical protein
MVSPPHKPTCCNNEYWYDALAMAMANVVVGYGGVKTRFDWQPKPNKKNFE